MNDDSATSVTHPTLKAITALFAAFGIATWSDAAAFAATVYTVCLLAEWLYKRFLKK